MTAVPFFVDSPRPPTPWSPRNPESARWSAPSGDASPWSCRIAWAPLSDDPAQANNRVRSPFPETRHAGRTIVCGAVALDDPTLSAARRRWWCEASGWLLDTTRSSSHSTTEGYEKRLRVTGLFVPEADPTDRAVFAYLIGRNWMRPTRTGARPNTAIALMCAKLLRLQTDPTSTRPLLDWIASVAPPDRSFQFLAQAHTSTVIAPTEPADPTAVVSLAALWEGMLEPDNAEAAARGKAIPWGLSGADLSWSEWASVAFQEPTTMARELALAGPVLECAPPEARARLGVWAQAWWSAVRTLTDDDRRRSTPNAFDTAMIDRFLLRASTAGAAPPDASAASRRRL